MLDREAPAAQASDHRVVVSQGGRSGRGPRLHQADRPSVARQDLARRERSLSHRRPPIDLIGGQFDLAEHDVDHAVEEFALVGDVVVERHRLDAEGLAELAHAQRRDSVLVSERNAGAQHPIARQRCSPVSGLHRRQLTSRSSRCPHPFAELTSYVYRTYDVSSGRGAPCQEPPPTNRSIPPPLPVVRPCKRSCRPGTAPRPRPFSDSPRSPAPRSTTTKCSCESPPPASTRARGT